MNPLLMQSIIEQHNRDVAQAVYPYGRRRRSHRPRVSRRTGTALRRAELSLALFVAGWISHGVIAG